MRQVAYIFDLDGTLCNLKHRLHLIERDKPDWISFNAACLDDKPVDHLIRVANSLAMEYEIICLTGRMDNNDTRDRTEQWLKYHEVVYDYLYMRKDNDYRADHVIKLEIYNELISDRYDVLGIFDDRDQVVKMWRSIGLPCYQVQEGDY